MTRALTIEGNLKIERRAKGAKKLVAASGTPPKSLPLGRIPRISKLMALAIRWEGLIREGLMKDYAEIAALVHVSRARVTQIMNLNLLAPDIQEELLFLPRIGIGRDVLTLSGFQSIALCANWQSQRRILGSKALRKKAMAPVQSKTASPR